MSVAVTGCASDEPEKSAPTPAPTPIAGLNSAAMQVPRIEFCASVPDKAVTDALGGKPDSKAAYGNGDTEKLDGVGEDVLHEIGCSWSTDEGATARAWVFARPVDAPLRPARGRLEHGAPRGAGSCRGRRTASRR